jgi:hypothetical protein
MVQPRKKRGRKKGLSLEAVINGVQAMNLKPGESVVINGMRFTKQDSAASNSGKSTRGKEDAENRQS